MDLRRIGMTIHVAPLDGPSPETALSQPSEGATICECRTGLAFPDFSHHAVRTVIENEGGDAARNFVLCDGYHTIPESSFR